MIDGVRNDEIVCDNNIIAEKLNIHLANIGNTSSETFSESYTFEPFKFSNVSLESLETIEIVRALKILSPGLDEIPVSIKNIFSITGACYVANLQ